MMNAKRFFFVMIGLVMVLIGLTVASVVLGSSMLQKQGVKLLDLKLQNKVLDEEQASLLQANKDIQKYVELEQIARTIVPQDKDQAKAVREIVDIANQSSISLKAINFPTSSLGQSSSGSSTKTSTPIATPTTLTQVKAVEGIPGVYSMEITIQSDDTKAVSYHNFLSFLQRLEQNRRTAQVTSITIQPSGKSADALNFNITLTLYIKP